MTNRRFSGLRTTAAIAVAGTAAWLLVAGLTDQPAAASGRPVSAQPGVTSLRLVARQDVFQFIDNAPSGDSAGDLVVTSDKVYDHSDRTQLGRDHIIGVETVPGKSIALTATLSLVRGEITLQGITDEQNNRPFSLAITGGTGAYHDATGVARVSPVSRTRSQMTLTIRQR
jgi:hypothetical protein